MAVTTLTVALQRKAGLGHIVFMEDTIQSFQAWPVLRALAHLIAFYRQPRGTNDGQQGVPLHPSEKNLESSA